VGRDGRRPSIRLGKVGKRQAEVNPFADLKSCAVAVKDRFYFVTRAEAQKVLDACPDAQWRLIFALARFGGLRCPSEILRLERQHVDWASARITVPSPKPEHHPGGASRLIPLFRELAETLPMQVVCEWIGNSQPIAAKHYLQVTDEHYQKAVHFPVQSVSAPTCRDPPEAPKRDETRAETNISKNLVGATGLEPVASWV